MSAKRIFLSPPWTGVEEREAVAQAFASGYVAPCGPMVDAFERDLAALAGRSYAVAVASGTAAIDLVCAHLGVDSSWIVVAPSLTFVATVGPAWHRGAKLAFVDCDATGNVDVRVLDAALERAGRVSTPGKLLFISVDLYGRSCDNEAIAAVCARRGAIFVADSAEAVGATTPQGRPAGFGAYAAIYSFNGNKIVTTSGGGALLTDDPALAAHVRSLSQQSREAVAWYEHREVGYNYRMSNLLGALGSAQLRKLPQILAARRRNRERYAAMPALELLPPVAGENNWLTVALLPSRERRDALIAAFAADNIESRPVWKPMHLQPVFAGKARMFLKGDAAVCADLFERGICLPSGTGMDDADWERIERVICTQL